MSLKRKLNYDHSSLGFFGSLILLWIFVMLTSFAVSLKNVHQRTTKIFPFDFNGHFSQFPNFIKMPQPTCNYCKMLMHVDPRSTWIMEGADILIIRSRELNTNHVRIKRNSCILICNFLRK